MSLASTVIIFVTVWWALSVVFERKQDRDYPAFKYIMGVSRKEETGFKRILKPVLIVAGAFVGESRKQTIKEQLKMADIDSTPEEFLAAQVILGLGGALTMLTVYGVTQKSVFLLLAPIAGVIMFLQPNKAVKNKIIDKKKAIKSELPDFIDTLLLLTEAGYTPYQAIKQVTSYTGGVLGREVKEMAVEMEATADEIKAMKNFAERMQIPELSNFVAAMIQASTTDSTKAKEIYAQQSFFMREMRMSNLRRLIKELPARVKGYNFLLFIISIAIPLIPLAVMFLNLRIPQ